MKYNPEPWPYRPRRGYSRKRNRETNQTTTTSMTSVRYTSNDWEPSAEMVCWYSTSHAGSFKQLRKTPWSWNVPETWPPWTQSFIRLRSLLMFMGFLTGILSDTERNTNDENDTVPEWRRCGNHWVFSIFIFIPSDKRRIRFIDRKQSKVLVIQPSRIDTHYTNGISSMTTTQVVQRLYSKQFIEKKYSRSRKGILCLARYYRVFRSRISNTRPDMKPMLQIYY